jgi:hypothetical protein
LLRVLYGQLLALSLIYSANQSKQISDRGGWRFTYGVGQVAELTYSSIDGFSSALGADEPGWSPWEAVVSLAETVLWAYEDTKESVDRLHVLQSVVGERLQSNDAVANGRLIVRHALPLHQQIEWSWQSYIEGKLKLYFDRVRQLEDLVAQTVEAFGEQVRTLVKGVTDSMLAGVAVVVGSFLGALFSSKFNAPVFRLGVLLYAAYLAVFPGALGLTSAYQQFATACRGFIRRKEEFKKRLFADSVDVIVGNAVDNATGRFEGWFVVAVAVYAVVIVVLFLAALFVPDLMS